MSAWKMFGLAVAGSAVASIIVVPVAIYVVSKVTSAATTP